MTGIPPSAEIPARRNRRLFLVGLIAVMVVIFREAVAKYGSEHEAARWVALAATSAHVSGDAVDITEDPRMRQ